MKFKKPNSRKIREATNDTLLKIEEMINETMETDYIQAYPIENFNIDELSILGDYAKENDIFVSIRAEYSNFHQGNMIQLINRNFATKFINYL